jgi:DNA repair exonuclease SbcCD ATPase subunit
MQFGGASFNSNYAEYRGKDINDTQKQINELLGLDIDTYLAGAYYHEFSQTAQFFITSAKNRRALIEQIVDLSKVVKLQENLSIDKKRLKSEVSRLEISAIDYDNRIQEYTESIRKWNWHAANFKESQESALTQARNNIAKLELLAKPVDYYLEDIAAYKEAIKLARQEKCSACNAPTHYKQAEELQAQLSAILMQQKDIENVREKLTKLDNDLNEILHRENNYENFIVDAEAKLKKVSVEQHNHEELMIKTNTKLADISVLSEIADTYRALTISSTIEQLETMTNDSLTKYFDAEIKVSFSATSADKLEVEVYNNGNLCTYTQLSKGQRCLLKLCFGVAVMQSVANRHGIDFDQVWFDEALDGLDASMKLKAFKLLQSLPNRSIFIVEHHAPVEIDFAARYNVTNINGESKIEQT